MSAPEADRTEKPSLADQLSFVLTEKILDLLKESGANQTEAICALDGARAFLPELELRRKPDLVI